MYMNTQWNLEGVPGELKWPSDQRPLASASQHTGSLLVKYAPRPATPLLGWTPSAQALQRMARTWATRSPANMADVQLGLEHKVKEEIAAIEDGEVPLIPGEGAGPTASAPMARPGDFWARIDAAFDRKIGNLTVEFSGALHGLESWMGTELDGNEVAGGAGRATSRDEEHKCENRRDRGELAEARGDQGDGAASRAAALARILAPAAHHFGRLERGQHQRSDGEACRGLSE